MGIEGGACGPAGLLRVRGSHWSELGQVRVGFSRVVWAAICRMDGETEGKPWGERLLWNPGEGPWHGG